MLLLVAVTLLTVPAFAQPPPLRSLSASPQLITSCWRDARPRTLHGFPGITPEQCSDAGSCFDSTYPDQPWCFYPNATPTTWESPGPVERYAGSQAAPALASRLGSSHASETGDVAGVSCLNAPPLAQTCDVLSGGAALPWPYALAVAGSTPLANASFQWGPYELQRWAAVGPGSPGGGSGCTVATALRPSSRPPLMLLLQVNITCDGGGAPTNLTLALPAHLSALSGVVWSWGRPSPPPNPKAWNVTLAPANAGAGGGAALLALSSDATATSASGVWAPGAATVEWGVDPSLGAATLAVTWPQGQQQGETTVTVGLVLASVSHNATGGGGAAGAAAAAAAAAAVAANDFPTAFSQAQYDWEEVWVSAFTPGNALFSGSLPVLPPSSPLARPYYAGVVSLLQLLRNVSAGGVWALPTAGPVWATTDTYLWDSSTVGTLMALLEPTSWLRDTLGPLLTSGTHTHYARDYLSGQGVGPWYSFNDVSMFALLDKYGRATAAPAGGEGGEGENTAFYNSSLAGKRVVEWMDEAATYWQGLVAPNSSLADYGLAYNLLECVPTYLHQVPALNAANVAMMRRVGEIWVALGGNASRVAYLAAAADALQPHVLALYAGDGTWDCQYPAPSAPPASAPAPAPAPAATEQQKRVNVRTVIDFIYTTDALGALFPPTQRDAMLAFLRQELLVPGDVWLRALSLSDAAAPSSDRADHGPLGSYTGWPPLAALAVAQLGYVDEGVRLLGAFAGEGGVLSESCFGQAHRILVSNFSSGAGVQVIKQGIAGGQDFFEAVGGAFAEVALQLNAMQQKNR